MVELTRNAREVLKARYLIKNKKGRIVETPEQMFLRVARNIALADVRYLYSRQVKKFLQKTKLDYWELAKTRILREFIKNKKEIKETEQKFYKLMASLDFLPNSPTLFNAGRELQQLAACFVLPVEDSIDSIFKTLYKTAKIHQSGGGTGFSFSSLRPEGDIVSTTDGKASGPVSFMQIFDCATEQIRQGGKRRGANMGVLSIDHPDIEKFATAKDEDVLGNFNISIAITDKFMKAVKSNKDFDLVNPRNKKTVKTVKAKKLFSLICRQAWKNADPGCLYIDTINHFHPLGKLGWIKATNPCGEQPLLPYEACNLGSINLSNMVREGEADWEKLRKTVHTAVHFLDNVIDMCNYNFPEIKKIVLKNRKIGLGVMGFAEMLIKLEISYKDKKAVEMAERVMGFIQAEARKASRELARKRGKFPNAGQAIGDFRRLRNATVTTIAPTGTISIIAGCSSSIEPLFALAFSHTALEGKKLQEVNKLVREKIKNKKIIDKIKKTGTLKGTDVSPKLKKIFVTAMEIQPEQHLKIQAAFQKYTDNAVSKTVNLPRKATTRDVEKIYMQAWELKCKGVTVYRYGSKQQQVLTFGTKKCLECD